MSTREPDADTHASFELELEKKSNVQNNNYSFIKIHLLSLSTSYLIITRFFFFRLFDSSTIVDVSVCHLCCTAPIRLRRGGPSLPRSLSPCLSRSSPFCHSSRSFSCFCPSITVFVCFSHSPDRGWHDLWYTQQKHFPLYPDYHSKLACGLNGGRVIRRYKFKKIKQNKSPSLSSFFFFCQHDVVLGLDISQGSKPDRLRIRISDWDPRSRSAWRRRSEAARFWACRSLGRFFRDLSSTAEQTDRIVQITSASTLPYLSACCYSVSMLLCVVLLQ